VANGHLDREDREVLEELEPNGFPRHETIMRRIYEWGPLRLSTRAEAISIVLMFLQRWTL
jgi:hypothetical protein